MKIGIESNILKHYLRNVYFITGTAYAGKSTMVRMLADRCGMIFCGENYHHYILPEGLLDSRSSQTCAILKPWKAGRHL